MKAPGSKELRIRRSFGRIARQLWRPRPATPGHGEHQPEALAEGNQRASNGRRTGQQFPLRGRRREDLVVPLSTGRSVAPPLRYGGRGGATVMISRIPSGIRRPRRDPNAYHQYGFAGPLMVDTIGSDRRRLPILPASVRPVQHSGRRNPRDPALALDPRRRTRSAVGLAYPPDASSRGTCRGSHLCGSEGAWSTPPTSLGSDFSRGEAGKGVRCDVRRGARVCPPPFPSHPSVRGCR